MTIYTPYASWLYYCLTVMVLGLPATPALTVMVPVLDGIQKDFVVALMLMVPFPAPEVGLTVSHETLLLAVHLMAANVGQLPTLMVAASVPPVLDRDQLAGVTDNASEHATLKLAVHVLAAIICTLMGLAELLLHSPVPVHLSNWKPNPAAACNVTALLIA